MLDLRCFAAALTPAATATPGKLRVAPQSRGYLRQWDLGVLPSTSCRADRTELQCKIKAVQLGCPVGMARRGCGTDIAPKCALGTERRQPSFGSPQVAGDEFTADRSMRFAPPCQADTHTKMQE